MWRLPHCSNRPSAYSDDHGLLPFRIGQLVDLRIELIVPPAEMSHMARRFDSLSRAGQLKTKCMTVSTSAC
jgi:hypothetical protein